MKAEATEGRPQRHRGGGGRERHADDRPTREANGPSKNRGKRQRNKSRPKNSGEPRHQGNRHPDKGNAGGIANVRFMDRPRRPGGGMSQGSASR
jgi:hypothetical protein